MITLGSLRVDPPGAAFRVLWENMSESCGVALLQFFPVFASFTYYLLNWIILPTYLLNLFARGKVNIRNMKKLVKFMTNCNQSRRGSESSCISKILLPSQV